MRDSAKETRQQNEREWGVRKKMKKVTGGGQQYGGRSSKSRFKNSL